MIDRKIPRKIDVVFKESHDNNDSSSAKNNLITIYKNTETGPSSLYGRRGDNITFHTQGVQVKGYWDRQWSWVWKDLREAFLGLLHIFFSREK